LQKRRRGGKEKAGREKFWVFDKILQIGRPRLFQGQSGASRAHSKTLRVQRERPLFQWFLPGEEYCLTESFHGLEIGT
jgi:hypothetical protein